MTTHSSLLAWRVDRGAWWATIHGLKESDVAEQLTVYFHFPPPLHDNPALKKSVYISLKQHICSQVILRKQFLVASTRICFISLREVVTEHWFFIKGRGKESFGYVFLHFSCISCRLYQHLVICFVRTVNQEKGLRSEQITSSP